MRLDQIAQIGELLQSLTSPPKNVEQADNTIEEFIKTLEGLELPHTLGTAQRLQGFQRETLRKYSPQQGLSNAHDAELATIAGTIITALHHEAAQKTIIMLDPSAVAESLKKLPERLPFLTEAQTHLRNETIRCLECGAYRSAVVMAWNFAYDYIRHWVYSNHLAAFNDTLLQKYQTTKAGTPQSVFQAIARYDDFWESKPSVGERILLDTCETAWTSPQKVGAG